VMINDQWPNPPADGVGGPVMKLKYRNPSLPECTGSMDSSTTCFDTLSYIDSSGTSNANSASVSDYYMSTYYDFAEDVTVLTKLYLIVRNGEARYGWWNSADQKWMMTWASLGDAYSGGSVGFFTYAHQPYFQDLYITDLDVYNTDIANGMCGGHGTCTDGACTCDVGYNFTYASTGLCGIETQDQTSAPSVTPVPTPVAYVGAGDVCVGNDASSTLLDFDATMSGWTEVDDVQDDGSAISSPCAWTAYASDDVDYLQVLGLEINGADGSSSYAIHQTSNAWGNYPGDNTLTGCNLLYDGASYTNFILEAKMYHNDNDGVGFVFGWNDLLDHYQAAMINDQWPSPPADGISGPHMKIKRRRKACEPQCSTPYIDGNTEDEDCYETLAYLNNGGPSEDMQGNMEGAVSNYHATEYIAYPNYGVPSETAASLYLIVKNNEVRMTRWEATEQKWVSAWATLPSAYAGGKIGLFTYAHQPTIWDVKITDLDATPNPEMCNGIGTCYLGTCDCGSNPFGDDIYSATGLCDSTAAPVAAPTSSPTMAPITVTASVALGGVACADFGADEQAVLITALAASLDGVEEEDMDIDDETGCTDTRRRLSTADSGRRRAQSSSASIDVDITTSPSSSGSDDASSHADAIQSSLTAAVSSGTLSDNIATAAAASSSTTMASVTATSVSVAVNIDPSAMPTAAPTKVPTPEEGDVVAKKSANTAGADTTMIIILVVVLVALSGTAVVVFIMIKQKPGSKPAEPVPEMSGAAMAVPVSAGGATPAGATKEGVAISTAASTEMTQQPAKSSVAI